MDEEPARMMRLAQRDVRAVRGMVDDAVAFSDEIFGFHAQQAVEKSAKAWLGGLMKPSMNCRSTAPIRFALWCTSLTSSLHDWLTWLKPTAMMRYRDALQLETFYEMKRWG